MISLKQVDTALREIFDDTRVQLLDTVYEKSNDVINPSNVNMFILRISDCNSYISFIPGYNLDNFSMFCTVVSNNNPLLPVASFDIIAESGCTMSNLTNRPG